MIITEEMLVEDKKAENTKRWKARIKYVDGNFITVFIEEIEDLQNIVEYGPDFKLIDKIIITYVL